MARKRRQTEFNLTWFFACPFLFSASATLYFFKSISLLPYMLF